MEAVRATNGIQKVELAGGRGGKYQLKGEGRKVIFIYSGLIL